MAAAFPRGNRFVKPRLRPAALVALATAVLGGCDRPETLTYRALAVTASELLVSPVPAWSALVADLDSDGVEELVLAGHRGEDGPGFCRLDGNAPCRWQAFLGPAADRHYCTTGDVDGDGDLDLYCTAGADRGAGFGRNELWYQVGPMAFEAAVDALGAAEASGRGRLATFFDFDHDPWPDLVTTTWGTRSDGGDNRSKVWRNDGGRFLPVDASLPPAFGARCLTVADINADGFDDLLGCPAEVGLIALLNRGGSGLEATVLGVAQDWYWDVQFLQGVAGKASLLVSTGGTRGEMFIEIARLAPTREVTDRRRLACSQARLDDDADMYCGRLLLHDANGDGHVDILVSRRLGWRHEDVRGDAPDLLIYGPDFREVSPLPAAARGAGERLIASAIGIVQVNAGEGWGGSVRLLRLAAAVADRAE